MAFPFRSPNPHPPGLFMRRAAPCLILIAAFLMPSIAGAVNPLDAEIIVKNMESAYAAANDYQANLDVRTYREDGSFEVKKFLYTFKKPKWIRLDFESPYSGMILVYPDRDGNVVMRYFFTLHLSPNSYFLETASGQRIDQTNLGLLIRNIARSLTGGRRGPVEISEDDGKARIQILAQDHFHNGVVTRYRFWIDEKLWLPVQVEESTPEGVLKRTILFRNLRTNIGFSNSFFRLNGG